VRGPSIFLLFACILLTMAAAPAAIQDLVSTDAGPVSGISGSSQEVHVYKGIPYAAAPTGLLRWGPPQPAPPREGVLKADHCGRMCMQASMGPVQP
jgi:para-nitrobenzyl esterase